MYCKCDNEAIRYDFFSEQDGDEIIHFYSCYCWECGRRWKHIEKFVMMDYWDEEVED